MSGFGWAGLDKLVMLRDVLATTKEGVLRELLDLTVDTGRLGDTDLDEYSRAILGGDCVLAEFSGEGVLAIHAEHSETTLAVGRSVPGLDFGASDGHAIHVVLLLLGRRPTHLESSWIDSPLILGMLPHLCVEGFASDVMAAEGTSEIAASFWGRCHGHLCSALERTGSLIEIQAKTVEGVLRDFVEALADTGLFGDVYVNELVDGLSERERMGSTGFGKGIAMPRVRHPGLSEAIIAIGRSVDGADFNALDRGPVYIFTPILAPTNAEEQKVVLELPMVRCLQHKGFRDCVRNASGLSDVLRVIDDCGHDAF
jgi:mannitol/fructose-specific phosphotransferase system IIA component (Ntr-type)